MISRCLSFLAAEANDHDTKPNRLREVRAVLAVVDHVGRYPAAYAEPNPLARAFDAIRDMPVGRKIALCGFVL